MNGFYVNDVCLNQLKINPPNAIDENNYVFPITYEDKENIGFSSKQPYVVHIKENTCTLHIKERSDLKFFNDLHKHLLELLYEKHGEWFESTFERKKYLTMFSEYLYPNIDENAVNIQCKVHSSVLENLSDLTCSVEVYPTFQLNSILFDNVSFQIDLELTHIDIIPKIKKEVLPNESNENMDETLENEVIESNTQELQNTDNLVEEVDIQPTETWDDSTININDQDYYILFKIVHSSIKDNFSNSILSLLQQKNINTDSIDIQNIAYDSDDYEDSEDEYLDNDDFEEDYKNIS